MGQASPPSFLPEIPDLQTGVIHAVGKTASMDYDVNMNIWMGFLFLGLLALFTGGMIHMVLSQQARASRKD